MNRRKNKRSGLADNFLLVEIAIMGFGIALAMPAIQAIRKAGEDGFTTGEILFSVFLAGPVAILGLLIFASVFFQWGYEFFIFRPKAKKEWQKMLNECSEKENADNE